MINLMLLNPWILAGALGGVVLVSFGGGFAVENWRKGAEIEKLKGENSLLLSVGGKCQADVRQVREAMQALKDETARMKKEAEEAMRQAEPEVIERARTITKIKTLPTVKLDMQCEAVKHEQVEYVRRRGS